jgi:hypothetical protein
MLRYLALRSDTQRHPRNTSTPERATIMLRFLVDRLHVSTPDSEVEANIRERCMFAREKGKDIKPEEEEAWIVEAINIHRENRRIHDFVVWAVTD